MNFEINTLESTKSCTFSSNQYTELMKSQLTIKKFPMAKIYLNKKKLLNNNKKEDEYFYSSVDLGTLLCFRPLLKYNINDARQLVEKYNKVFCDHNKKSNLTQPTINFIYDDIDIDIMSENDFNISFNLRLALIEENCDANVDFLHKKSIVKDVFIICKGYNLGTLKLPFMALYDIDEKMLKQALKSYNHITLSDFYLLLTICVFDYERALKLKIALCK